MGKSSNFTNVISVDKSLLFKGALRTPELIIKFTTSPDHWFTVWNDRVICKYNKEKLPNIITMRPYCDDMYSPQLRDNVIQRYHARAFLFRDTITQKRFEDCIASIKPNG